jgi:hypothetical protein
MHVIGKITDADLEGEAVADDPRPRVARRVH